MFLDIKLKYNKRKLESMILNNATKEEVLEQSQKLDKYILKKFNIINNKSLKSK